MNNDGLSELDKLEVRNIVRDEVGCFHLIVTILLIVLVGVAWMLKVAVFGPEWSFP